MYTRMKSILGHLLGRRGIRAGIADEKASAVYRKLLGRCPVCSGHLDHHAHWRLAAVVLDRPDDAIRLADLVAAGNWENAAKETHWSHDKDVREYQVVRCPIVNGVGLVAAVFTHGLWSRDYVEDARVLSQLDAARINPLAQDQWLPL